LVLSVPATVTLPPLSVKVPVLATRKSFAVASPVFGPPTASDPVPTVLNVAAEPASAVTASDPATRPPELAVTV
jgi:hypothetical protein